MTTNTIADVKITCLGHGNAFSNVVKGNSSYLVESGDHKILLDCGSTVPEVLDEMAIRPQDLTAIVISHLHADHVGGLERLLYYRRFVTKSPPIQVIMGRQTKEDWLAVCGVIKNGLEAKEYATYSSFGRSRHNPVYLPAASEESEDTYASSILSFRTLHGLPGSELYHMTCYSFLLHLNGKTIFFSGDRVWHHDDDEDIFQAMQNADLVLHEITIGGDASGVHTHSSEVPMDVFLDPKYMWHHHSLSSNLSRQGGNNIMLKGREIII